MNAELSLDQISHYQEHGYVVIDNFLSPSELEQWREAVMESIAERNGLKMPGKNININDDDGINKDAAYFNNVFD